MTDDRPQDRPDLDEAARLVAASSKQAERDAQAARERARRKRSLAQRLRDLREENGFEEILTSAFGGDRG